MRFSSRFPGLVATAFVVLAVTACHGGPKGVYKLAPEQRPLEVPPDLNVPETHGGMQIPALPNTAAATPAAVAALPAGSSLVVPLTSAAAFNKLGDALPVIGGATVNSSSPLLGVYDVEYAGGHVLLRVTAKDDASSQIAAMDPRGMPATDDAAQKLVAALKKYFSVK